jgi:hypothetical protein
MSEFVRVSRRLAPLCAAALGVAVLGCAPPALAQELYLAAGGQYTPSLREGTYAYSFAYQHNLGNYAFASFTWLNEGHVTDHHRDGYSPQFWLRSLSHERRLALALGVGPYRYYDTTYVLGTGRVTDAHDWGVLGSFSASYYFRAPWVLQLRYNYARASTSINTNTLLVGFGYQFEGATRPGPVVPPSTYGFASGQRWELTAMAGHTVVNNFDSPSGVAHAVELKRRLLPWLDARLTALDEGDAHVVKRKGGAGQLGLTREFLNHKADVGVAGGFYLARDDDLRGERTRLLGLLSMTMTYHLSNIWSLRAYWNRTLTTNGRDTDVALLGLGYSF